MSATHTAQEAIERREFEPLPKQKQFLLSTADQCLLSGSFGAGKSRIGCEKGFMFNMMYPGNRGLIVRKHFSDVRASTVNQTLLEEVIPDEYIHDHNKGEHVIKHYTGVEDPDGDPVLSEIHYHGLDAGRSTSDDDLPRKIGSMAYGWIFVDEGTELSEGEWNQLVGRLRYDGKRQGGQFYTVPFQQIFTATNPASRQHWMYRMFFEDKNGDVIQMNVRDNPYVPEDYVKRMERTLSGMRYERYFKGKWVGSEGMVYKEWDDDTHRIPPKKLQQRHAGWAIHQRKEWTNGEESVWASPPPDWRVYRAIDFGYNNPFVCQWWARSPDDELVLFRELYQSELLIEEAAEKIKRNTDSEWVLENTFADHDAQAAETLREHGVLTQNAQKDVEAGIDAVKSRMQADARGRPRLYIMQGARIHEPDNQLKLSDKPLKTADELPSYTWKDDDEDKPKKSDDHGMDAMRYLVYSIDGGPSISLNEMKEWEQLANGDWTGRQ